VEARADLLQLADAMAERVAQVAGVDRMPDASWDSEVIPYLQYVAQWLEQAAEVEADLPHHIERKCRQYVERIDVLLGLITDGQVIDAECFVCQSRTAQHPTGGGRTLRYRREHFDHAKDGPCGDDCRDYVVCEGQRCEPQKGQCGYWLKGHPAWDLKTEADWFGDQIGVKRAECEWCQQRIHRVSEGPTPVRYCSKECHREARKEAKRRARQAA
jgi:hypothetical protein